MSERFGMPDHAPQHAPDHALQNPTPSYSAPSYAVGGAGDWQSAGGGGAARVAGTKSVGLALFLAIVVGPLGLFYATVKGALVVLLVIPIVAVAAVVGVGDLSLLNTATTATWCLSIVWAVVAVRAHNKRLTDAAAASR